MYRVIKRSIAVMALVAALAAVSAPLASARFDVSQPTANSSAPPAPISAPPSTAADNGVSDGFAWGDAAIGAAAIVTVFGLGIATVLVTRRTRHAGHATTS